MRGLLQSLSSVLLLSVCVSQGASADPILVGDGRVLGALTNVNDLGFISHDATPPVPFEPFDGAVTAPAAEGSSTGTSAATQRSSVTPTRFHATALAESFGSASKVGDVVLTGAFSYFGVDFALPIPYRFTLTERMVADAFQSNRPDNFVHIVIADAESPILQEGLSGTGTRRLERTGILRAGLHSLFAQASTNPQLNPISVDAAEPLAHQRARFELDFQLTPVPEPGSMWLLGSGLAALVCRGVRREGRGVIGRYRSIRRRRSGRSSAAESYHFCSSPDRREQAGAG